MCVGASPKTPKPQPLPPVAPMAPTMADPAVQQSSQDAQARLANSGLASTSLAPGLGGQGAGAKKLAGGQ